MTTSLTNIFTHFVSLRPRISRWTNLKKMTTKPSDDWCIKTKRKIQNKNGKRGQGTYGTYVGKHSRSIHINTDKITPTLRGGAVGCAISKKITISVFCLLAFVRIFRTVR